MIRVNMLTALVLAAAFVASDDPSGESLSAWEYYLDVPAGPTNRLRDFIMPAEVFGKCRDDLSDLRLYAAGREIPIAVRVLHRENRRDVLQARMYNRVINSDGAAELRLDLGENRGEHNEIQINVAGTNFRRRFQLDGSDTDGQWNRLLDKDYVMHFEHGNQSIDVRRFIYTPTRFRYLRLLVFPDAGAANKEAPHPVDSVQVSRTVEVRGEEVTRSAEIGPREPMPTAAGPGSDWWIGFGGAAPPCEQLMFDVAESDFVRPFELYAVLANESKQMVASGEWRRRGEEHAPLVIRIPETFARQYRLMVTDQRNEPLHIMNVQYKSAARQVIFAAESTEPLRLYFGNPRAQPPGYDFAANLPPRPTPPPERVVAGNVQPNPIYQPAPKPWTERWPWVVYAVLGLASLILLLILTLLGRRAVVRHDAIAAATAGV